MAPQLLAKGLEFEDKVMNKYAFGNNLLPILKEKHIKLLDLSEEIGVHMNTISGWVNGKHSLPADKLYMISKIVGVSMDDLMRGYDDG